MIPLNRQYLVVKSIGKKSRMMVARDDKEGKIDSSCLVVIEFQFYKMKEF